uniref:Uncharacterized protein n=1 Tax=Enterobacter hormaechei subsp. xiangfangensis TaxID=1296536 RepID=A0A6C0L3M1_9ENTR|nr:hypothetical protein pLAU_ENM30_NDM1_00019 [Enterobacter hormaechei subsp. xiangfangensis]
MPLCGMEAPAAVEWSTAPSPGAAGYCFDRFRLIQPPSLKVRLVSAVCYERGADITSSTFQLNCIIQR